MTFHNKNFEYPKNFAKFVTFLSIKQKKNHFGQMSSRQVKWIREQMKKNKKRTEEEDIEDDSPLEESAPKLSNFALLKDSDDEYDEEGAEENEETDQKEAAAEEKKEIYNPPPPPPPSTSNQNKKNKKQKQEMDEDDEFAFLAMEIEKKKQKKEQEKAEKIKKQQEKGEEEETFQMSSLNMARELKKILGTSAFDSFMKLPKNSSANRFIAKQKYYPTPFPQFFQFKSLGDNEFAVDFTELGSSQLSIFSALQRINDIQGIVELGPQMPMCPLIIPVICQQRLFNRDFDGATDVAMRALYVIQQSLPNEFVPMKSKLLPSPALSQFLQLIAFAARFAFRRCCFETATALWKFGISLTDDDPENFLLLAAVPALYAKDEKFIDKMLASDAQWRGIPIKYIPDWSLVKAMFSLPDDVMPLANEIAKWSFAFVEDGAECNLDVPPFLSSIGEAFKRRTKKFFEGKDEMLQTAAMLSTEIDMTDEQAIAITYWSEVDTTGVDVADFVEEMVLPTG